MYLEKIILSNFKNIASCEVTFSPNLNVICGNNGEGKTNFLDAIHYLSMTKSFSNSSDKFTYSYDAEQCTLFGNYFLKGQKEKIAIKVRAKGDKIVKRNDKSYPKISEHIGLLPVVMISPSDTALINASGEDRRRFLNMILSQLDSKYLKSLQSYNRVLVQRNHCLKIPNPSWLLIDTFSEKLAKDADYIYLKRKELIEKLSIGLKDYYSIISGNKEQVYMSYTSDLNKATLLDLLENNKERDTILKYTSCGVQRDDISFVMNDYPLKKCASQGQQKSFLISLKMSQYSLMKEQYGFRPILLLDDVFDKLDASRVKFLINMVAEEGFGQIFITDSNKVRIAKLVNSITDENKFFLVRNGEIEETTEID
ncbi:MAG: DNA replication/repair protein RecF [Bacteroidales bacterium]